MPLITPLAGAPTGANAAPEKIFALAPDTVLVNMPDAGGVDVKIQVTQNCSVRPYFWQPVPGHVDGGAWMPLGGDAVANVGSAATSAAVGTMNNCGHGRYQDSEGGKSWIVCHDTGAPGDTAFCILDFVRRAPY